MVQVPGSSHVLLILWGSSDHLLRAHNLKRKSLKPAHFADIKTAFALEFHFPVVMFSLYWGGERWDCQGLSSCLSLHSLPFKDLSWAIIFPLFAEELQKPLRLFLAVGKEGI